MPIKVMSIDSIGEYYDSIIRIEKEISDSDDTIKPEMVSTLWFRAESQTKFTLIPSLYRDNISTRTFNNNEKYSNMHYAEDVRMQQYSAKNYHYLAKEPSSRIEWLEVMQHHGVRTRVLDWSESSTHSLLFALESFYNNKPIDYNADITPCVWVLNPQGLNKAIIQWLKEKRDLERDLLRNLDISDDDIEKILLRIDNFTNENEIKKYTDNQQIYHINDLYNLSSICDEMSRNAVGLGEKLANGELNPLFYILMRIYADGYMLDTNEFPPLAVTHPYHSERIKTQKGVFTVFPFYRTGKPEQRKLLKDIGINPDSMSLNPIAQGYLYKLIIRKPQKVAREILANGMNESWLYPEMPIVSGEIENHRVN